MRVYAAAILFLLIPLTFALAGEADVVSVEAVRSGGNIYQFNVTVSHKDEGWNHYVNKWDVVGPDDTVLGTRTLHHPHVDEQPFMRSLSGVTLPKETNAVTVQAHDSIHEYGGKVINVVLPR